MLAAQASGFHPALGDLSVPFNFNHRHITDLLYDDIGTKRKKDIPAKTKKGTRRVDWTLRDCEPRDVAAICCGHAQATYLIWETLKDRVPESYTLDMELIPLLMSMHQRGIRVDTKLAQGRYKELSSEIDYIRMLCEGMGFNPGSPKQIGLALAHDGFMTYFSRTGQMVTDEEALRPLMDKTPIVPLVLRFREKSKLVSTYIKPLCNVDRVYPRYHIVRTGRFASSPNIQNIPDEQRDLYLPDEGDYIISLDAHQIEPRIMAYLSGDPLQLADIQTGDSYQPIATRYSISRYTAKQLYLAASYEAGAEALVEAAHRNKENISQEDAQHLITSLHSDYQVFKQWKDRVRREARVKGYVLTMLGRKRTLESMMEGEEPGYDPTLKAVNSIVQGSAADILKLGMLRLKDYKIVATIHDEILISKPDDGIDLPEMSNLCEIYIPWVVKKGKNWGELR